jgi:hypothetical protein
MLPSSVTTAVSMTLVCKLVFICSTQNVLVGRMMNLASRRMRPFQLEGLTA